MEAATTLVMRLCTSGEGRLPSELSGFCNGEYAERFLDQRPRRVPSGSVASINWPPFVPSLSGWMLTVTDIPASSVF
jgi:hypothetical protein